MHVEYTWKWQMFASSANTCNQEANQEANREAEDQQANQEANPENQQTVQ